MVSKLLNTMLYRQTLIQRSMMCKMRELGIQLDMHNAFLEELKEAQGYNDTEFKKLEDTVVAEEPVKACKVKYGSVDVQSVERFTPPLNPVFAQFREEAVEEADPTENC